jgi:hypothetical protein
MASWVIVLSSTGTWVSLTGTMSHTMIWESASWFNRLWLQTYLFLLTAISSYHVTWSQLP